MKQQDLLNWPRYGPPRNIEISLEPGGQWSQPKQIWEIDCFFRNLLKKWCKHIEIPDSYSQLSSFFGVQK